MSQNTKKTRANLTDIQPISPIEPMDETGGEIEDGDHTNESEHSLKIELEKQKKIVSENYDKFLVTVRPLIAFLVGAVIGAKTMDVGTFWSYVIPLTIILVIILELLLKLSQQKAN